MRYCYTVLNTVVCWLRNLVRLRRVNECVAGMAAVVVAAAGIGEL